MRLRVLVLAFLFGAAAPWAPPAEAVTTGSIAINGVMRVGAGIAYPCFHSSPPVALGKCLPPDSWVPGGNSNDATFTLQATGVGGFGKAVKSKCGIAPACGVAGTFDIGANGTIHGACGLSTGEGTGWIANDVVISTKFGTGRSITFQWVDIGHLLIVTGTFDSSGAMFGTLVAAPHPLGGNYCTDKTTFEMLVAGQLHFVRTL